MSVHQFQQFWISCMYVSLISASLQYQNQVIFGYLQFWMRYIFKFSRDIHGMSVHQFQKFQISCMSVSFLIASLHYQNQVIFGYLQFWMKYIFKLSREIPTLVLYNFRFLSETFRRHSWNVCKLIQNEFIVFVCEFFVFTGVNFETSGLVLTNNCLTLR